MQHLSLTSIKANQYFFQWQISKKLEMKLDSPDENKKYFCNTDAYGSPNPQKSVDLAPRYWKFPQKYRWPALDTQDLTERWCSFRS